MKSQSIPLKSSVLKFTCMQVIASKPNVCKQLHMPAQSGSSSMLERMRRGYTRQAYDDLVQHARRMIPGVALSTDIISGVLSKPVTPDMSTHTQVS